MAAIVTREQIVAEALSWIGTPFKWQGSAKGRGVDCKGLVYGVARELGLPEAARLEARIANYRLDFKPAQLLAGLRECLIETDRPGPGDVMAIEIDLKNEGPRHLAILTGGERLVHCYGKGPIQKVIEVPIGRSRLVHSHWTWPSLGGARGD